MVRLYSNGIDLDLGEFATTLTFSIADIREPDKRNASFSKTLTLPGTKANNLFFENMFEVDVVTQTFNPNLKATTVLSVDGVTQFKGALKLRQVNYLVGGKVTYDCNLVGNLSDFIQTLGNARLRDLDLSAYDHDWTSTNIVNSWSPTLGVGYVYPMINFGTVSDLSTWKVTDLRPAVFAKTILDKIFDTSGFVYSSAFFISDTFKRLVIPNNNDLLRLSGTLINDRLFNAGRTTNYVKTVDITAAYSEARIQINDDSTGAYFDNDASFNTGTYEQVPLYNGISNYFLSSTLVFSVTKDATPGGQSLPCSYYVNIFRNRGGAITQMNGDGGTFFITPAAGAGTYTTSLDEWGATLSLALGSEFNDIRSGDKYYAEIGTQLDSTSALLPYVTASSVSMGSISFRNSITNDLINEADTIVMSDVLPDMLQKDFIMGLIKMFNLYLEQDKDDELLLNIEPRNTYYNSTQVDWSAKLATEKDLEIEPMALLNFKRILAQYKDDTDYYNKVYKQEYPRNYGSYLADIDNDFVNGDYKIEAVFSPTPLVGSFLNDRIIPVIFQSNTGTPPTIEPIQSNARILYWGGLKNCEGWTLQAYSGSSIVTQYPYAGHLDDPQAPTIDLSFGIPQKVYYGVNQYISSLTYTDNNLYNTYYSQMISEVTDRDSKLVKGYFWLTPVDILNLDFRKIYRVGSHALRLNKIYDYNPVKSNLTKCEFIKIKDTSTFVSNSEIMNGGIDIVVNARENAPVIDMSTFQDGNVVARPSTTVITGEKNYAGGGLSTWIGGKNNRVHGRASSGVVITGEDNIVQDGASGVVIHGYGNTVGFGVKNLFLQGNRNTVNPGLKNVSLINSEGQTVTENDLTYFNNTKFIKASGFTTAAIYATDWLEFTQLDLASNPIDIIGMEAEAGYYYSLLYADFSLNPGGVAFNFGAAGIYIDFSSQLGNKMIQVQQSTINSVGSEGVRISVVANSEFADNDNLQLTAAADATVGNGTYYFKIYYQKIAKPF